MVERKRVCFMIFAFAYQIQSIPIEDTVFGAYILILHTVDKLRHRLTKSCSMYVCLKWTDLKRRHVCIRRLPRKLKLAHFLYTTRTKPLL